MLENNYFHWILANVSLTRVPFAGGDTWDFPHAGLRIPISAELFLYPAGTKS